jgi:riboflavin kinase/FMN adenylyltransferase
MQYLKTYSTIELAGNLQTPVVSIGFFDGVHRGHQYLLKQLIDEAKKRNCDHLLISMWPHPSAITGNHSLNNFLLSTLDEKINRFELAGIKNLLLLDFSADMAGLSSEKFVQDVLKNKLSVSALLMGFNNTFGNKLTSPSNFEAICNLNNIEFLKAEPCCADQSDIKVSSSSIRQLIRCGNLTESNRWLGYNYSWKGKVVDGYKIGRTLGFPTANLVAKSDQKILPNDGVYLIYAKIEDQSFPAVLNIGNRPTFNGHTRSIEVHVLNFNKDIYQVDCEIEFIEKIRNEKRFETVDALKLQLNKDVEYAERYFDLR